MGIAATLWFEKGERLTRDRVRGIARGLSEGLLGRLRVLGRPRPERRTLEAALEETLAETQRHRTIHEEGESDLMNSPG
jgi:hypothetical protein